ncbi:MAG: DNA repair protein RecN [Spirochaetales bacterium]|nr:MAG: DNA repair protein RecN [Spirochaetales bacterium]
MLERIHIRNFALMDEVTVEFRPGFNVLSGETGAGKSILIDALSLALGQKGSAENIREGASEAEVNAVLRVEETAELREWMEKYGITPEDNCFLIRRVLKAGGRGTVSIQSVPVTRTALSELAELLVDIHGQHEHQSLFRTASHRKFLDSFAGLEDRVKDFTAQFTELTNLGRQLEALEKEESETAREAEFLRFAVEEIQEVKIRKGEEKELEHRQKIMARSEELAVELEGVLDAVSEARSGALSRLRGAGEKLRRISSIDASAGSIQERFESAFIELEDLVQDIRVKRDDVEFNPEEMEAVDSRLSRLGTLEKKYGVPNAEALLEYSEECVRRLEGLEGRGDERRKLQERKVELQNRISAEAAAISRERRKASSAMREKTELRLKALGMGDARFSVELEGKQNNSGKTLIGPYGLDNVEFLLSANRGESPKPLKSVASGGELSRVMLALKSVLGESDIVQTMVFDEVDTGIGGEVARAVGEHLHLLSGSKQVFCITHLASIAVFADNHLKVSKSTVDGRTVTRVERVDGSERVKEVARMLAGDQNAEASLGHAAGLLKERGWQG